MRYCKLFVSSTLIAFLVAVPSCGKKINASPETVSSSNSNSDPVSTPTNVNASTSRGAVVLGSQVRACSNVLLNPQNSGLEEFLNINVDNIEGAVTYCLDISGSSANAKVMFRLEWEDDNGLHRYPDHSANSSLNKDKLQLLHIDDNPASTEIILMDIEGFILVEGAVNTGTGKFEGSLRFVDIVPFKRDSFGRLVLDINGDPILEASSPGPWAECRDANYVDNLSTHLPGRFMDNGIAKVCATNFNIPHTIFGFKMNYVPSGSYTPIAITAAGNGFTSIQRQNIVGMARHMLDPTKSSVLSSLNVIQAELGDLENNPL